MHSHERSPNAPTSRGRRAISLSLILLAAGAAGCSDDHATVGVPAAESLVLFKDPSTSGPRLDVYDFDGHAAISVSGPIGSEGLVSDFKGGETLTELYRALHPNAVTVPADLMALDARLAPDLEALRSAARRSIEAEPAPIEKSESAFRSTLCKNFTEGSTTYTYIHSIWDNTYAEGVSVGWPTYDRILAGDRTYGWNANAYKGRLKWYKARSGTVAGEIILPPNWWNWMTLYSGGPYYATLWKFDHTVPDNTERGLTWHSMSHIVK
jgi:hypothetical protein